MATHEHTARRRRVHLTDSVAKRLAASGKPKVHYDDVQRGFGLRVGGRPTWVLCYSLNRREHRLTIGALSAWPAKAARIRAQELRQLVDRGVDPLATRQAERSAAVMGELLDLYLDQPKAKRSIADDRAMITAYIRPRWTPPRRGHPRRGRRGLASRFDESGQSDPRESGRVRARRFQPRGRSAGASTTRASASR